MNKHIPLILLVAALLLLPGCQKEAPSGGVGLPMRVAPTLAGETKGSLTTADLTDFYLQVVSDDAAYSYFEHASKDGSDAWTTPSRLFWKNEKASVSYSAARFGAFVFTANQFKNGVDLEVPADQSTQERLNDADLLTMAAVSRTFEETTDGTLPVALTHSLAKVTFTLTLGPKFYENLYSHGANPVKNFTVKGTGAGFNFQPKTGAVSVKSDTQANILPFASAFTPATAESKSATTVFEAILVPQALPVGALKVTFKVGTYDYEWSNASAITLEAGKTYDLAVSVTVAPAPEHAFVDMGNGLLWATCNVGATNPEDYGDYFAWGETEPKGDYNWATYKWLLAGQSDWKYITRYTFADGQTSGIWYDGDSFVGDGKTSFADYDYADDAARQNWGGNWRTPTPDEWQWLIDKCTWDWQPNYKETGQKGMLVTSDINGNQIFLPAAGYRSDANLNYAGICGFYWSSSLIGSYSDFASIARFESEGSGRSDCKRAYSSSVRPVSDADATAISDTF